MTIQELHKSVRPDHTPVPADNPARRYAPITPHSLRFKTEVLRRSYWDGELSESQLLRNMARATSLPQIHLHLTPPDPALADLLDPAFCLRHECLPWRLRNDCLWVATAHPETFEDLARDISARLASPPARILPVIVGREACQAEMAKTHTTQLTERMRNRVPLIFSCRSWRNENDARVSWTICVLMAFAALTAFAPAIVASVLITVALCSVAVAATMKSAAAIAHLTRPTPRNPNLKAIPPEDLPHISILVPLFREKRIAETLLKRLNKLNYPRQKLDILLVLEAEDTLTRDAIQNTPLPPMVRVVIVPDGAPRTKPRAMNYALDFCDGDIIGIYDAEDAPEPDQLLKVAATFADVPEDVVCLQGALDYYNPRSSWIARCFTIEYNTWFRLILPGMARLGFALPLGGTTLFFRRDKLDELGAWDAHNVTEDADLGFRLARAGYRTVVIDTTTGEEANDRALPWIRQRSRWLKGYLATYLVHMRSPLTLWRDLGPWQFLGFQAHFVTALTHFTMAPLILCFWLVALGVDLPFTTLDSDPRMYLLSLSFLAFEVFTMGLGAIATRIGGHRDLWLWTPLMHLYWPLGTIAMWKALYELVFSPFYWDKTDHGHSLEDDQPTVPTVPESSLSRVTKAPEI